MLRILSTKKTGEEELTLGRFLQEWTDKPNTNAHLCLAGNFLIEAAEPSFSFNPARHVHAFQGAKQKLESILAPQGVFQNACKNAIRLNLMYLLEEPEKSRQQLWPGLTRAIAIVTVLQWDASELNLLIRFARHHLPPEEGYRTAEYLQGFRDLPEWDASELEDWAAHLMRHTKAHDSEWKLLRRVEQELLNVRAAGS